MALRPEVDAQAVQAAPNLSPTRVVIVGNAPAPYRVPALRLLAGNPDISLEIVYCTHPHIDPSISSSDHGLAPRFLGGRYLAMDHRFLHSNWRVVSILESLKPDVVVTCGFIPTFLYAFSWTWLRRRRHVVFIDGTLDSEAGLSWIHRRVRRFVFARSAAFVGACEGSSRLFRSYGVPEPAIFVAPLAIANERFHAPPDADRSCDLLFSGRLIEHKNPLFALEVAAGVARRLGREVSISFLGGGRLLQELEQRARELAAYGVRARFLGHLPQTELPGHYANSRLFLFPTRMDTWGVVANEAAAAGVPVIVSPFAGVAGDLVRDSIEGRILPLELDQWVEATAALLEDDCARRRMGAAAQRRVKAYCFEQAARQLHAAIVHASS